MLLGPAEEAPLEEWEQLVAINVQGLLCVSHAAIEPLLEAAEDGPRNVADMVSISSVAGRVPRVRSACSFFRDNVEACRTSSWRRDSSSGTVISSWQMNGVNQLDLAGGERRGLHRPGRLGSNDADRADTANLEGATVLTDLRRTARTRTIVSLALAALDEMVSRPRVRATRRPRSPSRRLAASQIGREGSLESGLARSDHADARRPTLPRRDERRERHLQAVRHRVHVRLYSPGRRSAPRRGGERTPAGSESPNTRHPVAGESVAVRCFRRESETWVRSTTACRENRERSASLPGRDAVDPREHHGRRVEHRGPGGERGLLVSCGPEGTPSGTKMALKELRGPPLPLRHRSSRMRGLRTSRLPGAARRPSEVSRPTVEHRDRDLAPRDACYSTHTYEFDRARKAKPARPPPPSTPDPPRTPGQRRRARGSRTWSRSCKDGREAHVDAGFDGGVEDPLDEREPHVTVPAHRTKRIKRESERRRSGVLRSLPDAVSPPRPSLPENTRWCARLTRSRWATRRQHERLERLRQHEDR